MRQAILIFGAFIVLGFLSTKLVADTKKQFVPPGFEDLLEPQTTDVDVYYGGAYLLSLRATFTPTDIRFLDAESLVNNLPDILDKMLVTKILSADMPTNSALLCLKQNQSNCGKLEADDVAVIFDEGFFRVDLFISPILLAIKSNADAKFLPASRSGLSLLNVVGATINGQQGSSSNFNVSNSTTVALKETRFLGISNFTREEDFTFDTLALQREFNGRQYQLGYFRSNPNSMVFIREADFFGVSFSSSLDTRNDLDQSTGNKLQVFLDSRSRVELLKDGRLISSRTYETGNQILDTSKLPGGSYDIVIRVKDNFGNEKEETRFYSKTNLLPPIDQSLFFIDIGELVDKKPGKTLPSKNGIDLFRAGFSKRISSNFGMDLGVVYSNDNALFETGFFKLGRRYDVRLNLALGNENTIGAGLNGNFRLGRASISGNYRKIWSKSKQSIIGAESTQASLNVSIPFNRTALNFTARYNKRGGEADKNFGFRVDLPTLSLGPRTLFTDLQLSDNNGELLALLGLRVAFGKSRWQTDLRSRLYYDEQDSDVPTSGVISNIASRWQDGDRYLSDIDLSLRAIDDRNDKFVEAEFNIASNIGRANAEFVYSAENKNTSYSASFYTSVLANKDTFSFGGKAQSRSAIVLDIKGDVKDAFFDIEVNRTLRGNAQIGKKTILSLPPYQTYNIRLQARGDSLVDFGNQIKTTTLYPGNVVSFEWKATRILIAFGQIKNDKGEAMTNALIKGVIGLATTDDFGLFQAEIDSSTTEFTVKTRSQECRVILPQYDAEALVVMLGELTCI